VLQQQVADDDIPDGDAWPQPARHAGEQHHIGGETVEQQGRGGGCGHLPDARQDEHRLVAVQRAVVEVAPRRALDARALQVFMQRVQLFAHRADHGDALCRHGASLLGRRAYCGGLSALSRSSRRRILPTGDLGRSVRNSTIFGRL
jgi:hypothetical protein